MKLPKLYSKTSTGKIQQWQIFTGKNCFFTREGLMGGKLTTSKPTICKGKNLGKANATNARQQAEKEAKAKWDKRVKLNYHESIDDVDTIKFIQPMLAHKFVDHKDDLVYPVGVQTKFNGARCVATKEGIFSRKGQPRPALKHIWESLQPVFQLYPRAFFDFEAFNYELRRYLNKIIHIVNTTNVTPDLLKESEEMVRMYCYDGYGVPSTFGTGFYTVAETDYLEREAAIALLLAANPYYKRVNTDQAQSEAEIMKLYDRAIADGQEGIMIRDLRAPYQHKRTTALLKYKPTDDAEFKIVDVIEGTGNRAGTAGTMMAEFPDGRQFGANLKGDFEQFRQVLKHKDEYIGKMATLFFNGYNGKGLPNNAQFDCGNWMHE